jgi:hypothetical protein
MEAVQFVPLANVCSYSDSHFINKWLNLEKIKTTLPFTIVLKFIIGYNLIISITLHVAYQLIKVVKLLVALLINKKIL